MEQGSGGGEIAIFEAETGEIRVQVQEGTRASERIDPSQAGKAGKIIVG